MDPFLLVERATWHTCKRTIRFLSSHRQRIASERKNQGGSVDPNVAVFDFSSINIGSGAAIRMLTEVRAEQILSNREIDDNAGDIDEGGDKRIGGDAGIDAEALED